MTDITNRVLPPPLNWQDFERLCYDLYSHMWRTNDAEMHGRRGQPQAGVDVYGTDRLEGDRFVGVQCKLKEEGTLTERTLRDETKNATTFEPALQVFVIATTAPNDYKIQRIARSISQEHAKHGLFEVRVQGWDTLRRKITDYPEVLRKHFADLAPIDVTAKIEASITVAEREGEQTRTEIARLEGRLTAIGEQLDTGGDPLRAQITQAAKLTDDGSAHAAIRALRRIQEEQGEKLTGRNLYRLHSGIGFAHVALGELPKAIQEFRKAYEADPEWPSARSTLAVAELLEGDRVAAFERSRQALRDDATLHQAAAVMIDAAPSDIPVADIEVLVPVALRNRVDIAMGLSLRARKSGDFAGAEAYARRVSTSHQEDLRVLSTLAEVILEPILSIEGLGLTRLVPSEHQARFDEALDLLQRSWDQLKSRDDVWRYDHVVANLTTTLDIAGREADSQRILEDALRIAPRSTPLLRRYAQKLAQEGNWDGALAQVDAISSAGLEPPDELIRLHGLIRTGKAGAALKEAHALYERLDNDRLRESVAALRLEAASALGSLQTELDAALSAFPNSIVLRSVAAGLLDETDERRTSLLTEIDGLITGINDLRDRFYAAESLYKAKQYSRAADLYQGLYGTDKDDPALRRRLAALYFADRRLDARQLFDSLDEQIKALPQYAEIGAAIYERAGLLAQCRNILERTLLHQEDLQRRLEWLSLSERLNEPEVVIEWLNKVRPDQRGRPRDLMTLALTIDRYLGDPKCLPIAYRALRAAYDDPQIHLGYISIFLMGRTGRGQIDTPTEVGLDTAVVLAEKSGDRRLTRILETEPSPRVDRDEVSPNDPLAIRLMGLHVGDEVETKALGIGSITYVVTTLQNKYVYAHFRSLECFETMFPESRAFGSFKVDPAKGEDSFKPIFDAVKRRGEFAQQIEDMYRSGQLPLAMGAKLGGSDGFEFWESIHEHPGLQFNVAIGSREDYEAARQTLKHNRRAVIDPLTLWGLVRLRIAEIVRSSFDDLGVVQTTLDLLRRTVQKHRQNWGAQQGTLAWDGEHYRMIELGPEAIEYRISEAEAVLAFAETLTLVPAEASVEVPKEARKLYEDLDPAYFDTILATHGDKRVLLSDDRPYRALAAEVTGIKGVWSQPAVMAASVSRTLASDDYFKVAVTLAEAGYFYTTVNCGTFMYALRQSGWVVTPTLRVLIDLLARPQNDPFGVLAVLSELIHVAWAAKVEECQYEEFFTAIFAGFRNAQPQTDIVELVRTALNRVESLVYGEIFHAQFAEELKNSTNLTPVAAVTAKIDAIRNRIGTPITRVLSSALRRASARQFGYNA